MAINGLPLAESPPRKLDHLFVSMRDQSDPIDHFRKESRSVATPGETEHVDVVSGSIVLHEEFISSNNMVCKRGSDRAILHFHIPILKLFP